MLTIIFRVILALVHFGYVAFEKLKSRFILVKRFSSNVYWRLRSDWQRSAEQEECRIRQTESLVLKRSVERMNKLPVHLCMIFGECEERVSFHHLARILGWCVAVGIPYVSFYDHDGFLKQNQNILRTVSEKSSPYLAALIDWEGRALSTNLSENGHNVFKRTTRVQVFSNKDGKGEIVTLAQNLSRAVAHGLLRMEEINAELLNDKLRLENTPDPDVAFVCAPALSTYGLLPWHTRTTEFFTLRNYRDVSINDFTFLLEKYGLCQQRYEPVSDELRTFLIAERLWAKFHAVRESHLKIPEAVNEFSKTLGPRMRLHIRTVLVQKLWEKRNRPPTSASRP